MQQIQTPNGVELNRIKVGYPSIGFDTRLSRSSFSLALNLSATGLDAATMGGANIECSAQAIGADALVDPSLLVPRVADFSITIFGVLGRTLRGLRSFSFWVLLAEITEVARA